MPAVKFKGKGKAAKAFCSCSNPKVNLTPRALGELMSGNCNCAGVGAISGGGRGSGR